MYKAVVLLALFASFCAAGIVYSERCGFGNVDICTIPDDDWVMTDRANPRYN